MDYKISQLINEVQRLKSENTSLKSENSSKSSEIVKLTALNTRLNMDYSSAKNTCASLNRERQDYQNKYSDSVREIRELKSKLDRAICQRCTQRC
jgi:chromosome segregation ATPase